MGGLRFGFVDALVHSRLPPTLPARSSMAAATVMGADSYWVGDHLNALVPRSIATSEYLGIAAKFVPKIDANYEPWTMLGNLAFGLPSRLRLGVCVTDAGRRNPAVTAQAAATLHLLTRGRAILGIGVGEREGNEPYGVEWTKPVARFEEALATIRALWNSNGELISRESPYFPLHNALFDLPPYRGNGPKSGSRPTGRGCYGPPDVTPMPGFPLLWFVPATTVAHSKRCAARRPMPDATQCRLLRRRCAASSLDGIATTWKRRWNLSL